MPSIKNHNKFRTRAKLALVRRELSIKALAAIVGHPRETCSRAINSDSNPFPNVRRKIARHLSISAN